MGVEGTPFLHGVASGDASETGAVIWTRISGVTSDAAVRWTLNDVNSGQCAGQGEATTSADCDFTVKVRVRDLEVGHQYEYWFLYGGFDSTKGRFRTLDPSATNVRFAAFCCAKFNAGFFNAYRHVADEELDFVVHLGDYIYEAANVPPASQTPGANIDRDFDPPHECRTLSDYRRRYAQYRCDPDLQRLHAAHVMFATIDDHEIADNAWSGGADEHRSEEHGPWSARQSAALQAWEEWMPVSRDPVRSKGPIYTSWHVGAIATFVLLEARTSRTDPRKRGIPPTELGPEQLRWLTHVVDTCESQWLILGSPSMMSPIWTSNLDDVAKDALETLKLIEHDGESSFHDLWDSYSEERDGIISLLASATSHPVVISGDVHISVEAQLYNCDERLIPEWTIPSVTSQNLDDKKHWVRRTESLAAENHVMKTHRDWNYCNFDDHGFVLIEATESEVSCKWKFVTSVLELSDGLEIGHTASHRSSR